jgi:hypothetical protein
MFHVKQLWRRFERWLRRDYCPTCGDRLVQSRFGTFCPDCYLAGRRREVAAPIVCDLDDR